MTGASTSSKTIKIFIVDDHEIARKGLKALFEKSDMAVIGEAECCADALKKIPESHPDVVLLDIKMPGNDGFATLAELKKAGCDAPILMLTGYDSELYAFEALKVQADGFITKDSPKELIHSAILAVLNGGVVWEKRTFHKMLRHFGHTESLVEYNQKVEHEAPLLVERLSPRETEAMALIVKGCSNKQICQSLNLSEVTAKKLVSSIFKKLGVRNRTQAALIARDLGME